MGEGIVRLKKRIVVHIDRGDKTRRRGDFAEAIAAYIEALGLAPESPKNFRQSELMVIIRGGGNHFEGSRIPVGSCRCATDMAA